MRRLGDATKILAESSAGSTKSVTEYYTSTALLPLSYYARHLNGALQSLGNDEDDKWQEPLLVGALIVSLLVVLVTLRCLVNTCIDVCILQRDDHFTKRVFVGILRRLQPDSLRRNNGGHRAEDSHTEEYELGSSHRNHSQSAVISSSDHTDLLDTLSRKILTAEDVGISKRQSSYHKETKGSTSHDQEKDGNDNDDDDDNHSISENTTSSDNVHDTLVCSICLDQLRQGDAAVSPMNCQHWFHGPCMEAWVRNRHAVQQQHSSSSSANNSNNQAMNCPNCRTPLLNSRDAEEKTRL